MMCPETGLPSGPEGLLWRQSLLSSKFPPVSSHSFIFIVQKYVLIVCECLAHGDCWNKAKLLEDRRGGASEVCLGEWGRTGLKSWSHRFHGRNILQVNWILWTAVFTFVNGWVRGCLLMDLSSLAWGLKPSQMWKHLTQSSMRSSVNKNSLSDFIKGEGHCAQGHFQRIWDQIELRLRTRGREKTRIIKGRDQK